MAEYSNSPIINDENSIIQDEELGRFYIQELPDCKFDISNYVEEDRHLLYHLSRGNNDKIRKIGVGAEGNILVIGGLPKTRKTTLINAILSSAYTDEQSYTFGFSLDLSGDDQIVFVDTEQGKFYYYRNNIMLNKMSGGKGIHNLTNYHSYSIRPYQPFQRLEMIEHLVYNTPNIKVLAIDGIADLINDQNDRVETNNVINSLMKWTHDKGLLAILALHTSYSMPDKLTGVLGSELSKKMDSCFITIKDIVSEQTKVENRLSRGLPVKPFQFDHDEFQMPRLIVNPRYSAGDIIL